MYLGLSDSDAPQSSPFTLGRRKGLVDLALWKLVSLGDFLGFFGVPYFLSRGAFQQDGLFPSQKFLMDRSRWANSVEVLLAPHWAEEAVWANPFSQGQCFVRSERRA